MSEYVYVKSGYAGSNVIELNIQKDHVCLTVELSYFSPKGNHFGVRAISKIRESRLENFRNMQASRKEIKYRKDSQLCMISVAKK